MSTNPIPLRELSFPAYIGDADSGARTCFPSLMHFFEAEKFKADHQDIYRSIVDSTSLREIAKISKRNRALWRSDWVGIRGRVILCGMRYAQWADPNPERWTEDPAALAKELEELGFPAKFSAAAAVEFQNFASNPTWSFFGVDKAPEDVIGKRVNAIHRKFKRAWSINHWLGRHTSWRLHDWALKQYIPIRYFGSRSERLTPEYVEKLVRASSFSCVFEMRGGKSMDGTIRQIKGLKGILEIEFYSPASAEGSLL